MAKRPYNAQPSTRWCLLRSNELLRQLLLSKKDELRLTNKQIAEMAGLTESAVKQYLMGRRTGITQYGLIKLASVLGYEIKLDISVKLI